jgi:two-component system, OmpR family, sensor kinase
MRGRLRTRLFLWFGLAILATAVSVGALGHVIGGGTSSWRREVERVYRWLGGRFAEVWTTPAERDRLAASLARDLEIRIVLRAPDSAPLASFGPECPTRHAHRFDVQREGRRIGTVELCTPRLPFNPRTLLAGLALTCVGIWLGSGLIARRLARPHAKLAQVAQDIGAGRLQSRARLGRRQPREVGALADAINEMAERIERQISDQRQLLAMVSHELRGPLQHMRVLIELAREEASLPQLADLEREILEIDRLVGELLATSRLDFAAMAPRSLDAAELAGEALQRAGHPQSMLALEGEVAPLRGDATLLARAVANLVDNADRHGGGLQRLRVRGERDRVAFEAEDAGAGLPAGEEADLFLPFRRGSDAAAAGTGLGLALVKRIAEAHGGEAYAANRPGGGALVGFSIIRNPGT